MSDRPGSAHDAGMQTTIHEIAEGTYRFSTLVEDIPGGFTFNQYLIVADEPLLFHTGPRGMFPLVRDAVAKVMDVEQLRWISFGHVESDECGAMNEWLAVAPRAEVVYNALGCDISLNDLADRAPRAVQDGEQLDLGGHVVRFIATPHVPHGWEAQVLFDETTATLFCGDLGSQAGVAPAILHDLDIVDAMELTEDVFGATGLTPATAPTLRRLADLGPRTLAIMHGAAFAGDGGSVLRTLADGYERRLTEAAQGVSA